MSTTFRPGDANFKDYLELDVSVFNRVLVLEILGIKEDNPVSSISKEKIEETLILVQSLDIWTLPLTADKSIYYKSQLCTILGYCLGKECALVWS